MKTLRYQPHLTFSKTEFLSEKARFVKKLQKMVRSYFFVTEEKFDRCVFKLFKREFNDYIDFFLINKENLTKIKLIKRDFGVFMNKGSDHLKEDGLMELENDRKDLDYIDNPRKLWKDLDTKIKNLFVERFIGKFEFIYTDHTK